MLRNKDRMLPPGSLFTIVPWLSGRQASLNETLGFVHNGVDPLGLELLEFSPLQPEPAPERRPRKSIQDCFNVFHGKLWGRIITLDSV